MVEQPFRITNPHKTKSKITVKAWHVFFEHVVISVEPEEPVEE